MSWRRIQSKLKKKLTVKDENIWIMKQRVIWERSGVSYWSLRAPLVEEMKTAAYCRNCGSADLRNGCHFGGGGGAVVRSVLWPLRLQRIFLRVAAEIRKRPVNVWWMLQWADGCCYLSGNVFQGVPVGVSAESAMPVARCRRSRQLRPRVHFTFVFYWNLPERQGLRWFFFLSSEFLSGHLVAQWILFDLQLEMGEIDVRLESFKGCFIQRGIRKGRTLWLVDLLANNVHNELFIVVIITAQSNLLIINYYYDKLRIPENVYLDRWIIN